MNRFAELSTQLAGVMLIIGPALLVCAALLAAAGVGTTTGRWYDNWLEGILMAAGFALQLIGFLELSRRIGAARPLLGILITLTSVLGTVGAIFPALTRYLSAAELAAGITVEQLDLMHTGRDEMSITSLVLIALILCYFLTYILLAIGLWRANLAPRYASILLAIGVPIFMIGQTSSEVVFPAYIAGVSAWLLALAPLGLAILRSAGDSPEMMSERAMGG